MKRVFAACLLLVAVVEMAVAQPAAKPAAGAAPATGAVSTNKPDIKELMKGPVFTNSTEMVMVKVGGIWVGKFLVTQEEYRKVVGSKPSQFQGERNPVDSVSYNDAAAFLVALNDAERKDDMLPPGFSYTLPTQAQWESLAAGTPLDQAYTSQNGNRSGTAPVGSLAANSQGLCDIRGNLWEFCLDPDDKPYRVLRGGAWDTSLEMNLRTEFRWYSVGPDERKNIFGFRCVLVPGPAK